MFDIGAPELLVIAIVLIVVVGPKDLPKMLRAFGRTTTKLRAMAGDFRKQFDEAMREAELDDVKNVVSSMRKLDPLAEVKKELNPLSAIGRGIRDDLDKALKPDLKPMESPVPAPARAEPLAIAAKPLKGPAVQAKSKSVPKAKAPKAAPKMTPAKKAAPARPSPRKKGARA